MNLETVISLNNASTVRNFYCFTYVFVLWLSGYDVTSVRSFARMLQAAHLQLMAASLK